MVHGDIVHSFAKISKNLKKKKSVYVYKNECVYILMGDFVGWFSCVCLWCIGSHLPGI